MSKKIIEVSNKIKHLLRAYKLKKAIKGAKTLKIVLGAGGTIQPGWIATDIDNLDVTNENHWEALFEPDSISNILAEHVWEHLTEKEGIVGLKNCYRYLKKGGRVRIAVPDGNFPNRSYINYVKPKGNGPGARDHKILYTITSLQTTFRKAGFKRLISNEYFDSKGKFHYKSWNVKDGMVNRSKRFDDRNRGKSLGYTSLIIDGIK